MKSQIFNKTSLKVYRKDLRNNGTSAEASLWLSLKEKQLEGRKFRRQHSVENYILDFYCPAKKLAVELDGAGHYTEEGMAYDEERTSFLEGFGIKVIRFENREVFDDLEGVLEEIRGCFS